MTDESPPTSLAGAHPGAATARRLYVSPTRDGELNRVRERLGAIACWRMNHALFAFGSSFVHPSAGQDFASLASLLDGHPGALLSVFGHADPVGDDSHNKTLSGRRARAVQTLLTRDTSAWEDLFAHPLPGDMWGLTSLQHALSLVRPHGAPEPYFTGSASGHPNAPTQQAVRAFQRDHGLADDGIAGPKTRQVLFRAYMDALALGPERQLVLERSQFVGQGSDEGDKGAVQGCGELNPVFLLSRAENARFANSSNKGERDRKNEPNRRVMVLLFAPDAPVTATSWPCPRWSEPGAGCQSQLWPDGEERRTLGPEERTYGTDRRTMACRFYDHLVRLSPCEGAAARKPRLLVSFFVGSPPDLEGVLEIVGGDKVITTIPMEEAVLKNDYAVFELAPLGLPNPVTLRRRKRLHTTHVLGPCSPAALRDVCQTEDFATAGEMAFPGGDR